MIDGLSNVIEQCYKELGNEKWNYVFYCGKSAKKYWETKLESYVELRPLDVDNFPSPNLYSDFFKQKQLWEDLEGKFILTLQCDVWIMNTQPYNIEYFINMNKSFLGGNMGYDWLELTDREQIHFEYKNFNGGLSLRKRIDMIKVIETYPPLPTACNNISSINMQTDAEDVYFTIGCYRLGLPIGNDIESSYFSINSIFKESFFGIHRPWDNIKEQLNNRYPHLKNSAQYLHL